MHKPVPTLLHNAQVADVVPARLLRARGNAHARALAGADWLIRRKRDGRFLAVLTRADGTWHGIRLAHGAEATTLIVQALSALGLRTRIDSRTGTRFAAHRPSSLRASAPPMFLHCAALARLQQRLAAFSIPADYAQRSGLSPMAEPSVLHYAGRDRYRRPLWLHAGTARAWRRMRAAARRDEVMLDAISGFRSHEYQFGIFERKRARGLSIEAILAVNAAPGYSEHHTGRAIDIGTPGEPPAEESFERTAAFAWLTRRAGEFGFRLSYPRGNPHGIAYEPWHWYYERAD